MPSLKCPFPGCGYATENLGEMAAVALFNAHVSIHTMGLVGSGPSHQEASYHQGHGGFGPSYHGANYHHGSTGPSHHGTSYHHGHGGSGASIQGAYATPPPRVHDNHDVLLHGKDVQHKTSSHSDPLSPSQSSANQEKNLNVSRGASSENLKYLNSQEDPYGLKRQNVQISGPNISLKNEGIVKTNASQTSQHGVTSLGNFGCNTQTIFKMLNPSKSVNDMKCGIKRHYYGDVPSNLEERVILLLGASGSGKTTLVNFIANIFEGVKSPESEMVIIAKSSMKTEEITAYTFYSVNYPGIAITVIDTPGLNDTSGSEIRDHVNSLKTFLANTANHMKIHALGFVAQAHIVRLTSSERLVMDYVSTLFGEGVDNNIITLITFADAQDNPPIIEAMKSYGIKTKYFLKFNNAVFSDSSNEVNPLHKLNWCLGYKNWIQGMDVLKSLLPLSVKVMKKIQKEIFKKEVIDVSIKDLNDGLIDFLLTYNQGNHEEIRRSSHQVWDLVTVTHHHLRHTAEGSASLEIELVKSVDNVCRKQSCNSLEYLKTLSFYSSRRLDECAQAIISSIFPVYYSSKESNYINHISPVNESVHVQELLFCIKCKKDCAMTRKNEAYITNIVEKKEKKKIPPLIVFQCTQCSCDGNLHGVKPMPSSGGLQNFFGSDVNKILRHTIEMLSHVAKTYSLPNSNMSDKDLINILIQIKKARAETNTDEFKFLTELFQFNI